jgi:CDP-glucose 4,6-dehydratase
MLEFYKGKTVLITGATGFKGSWLSFILSEAGANVIGYSLNPPTTPSLFDICHISNRITNVIGDIRDFDHLLKVFQKYQPEIVFHLAAQPIVLTSYKEPRYTYETNVMGTVSVLEAARLTGCVKSLLNVTTDKVYENNNEQNHLFTENEKLDGYDPYSNSKSCSELVTHSYKNSFFASTGTKISTARAGNVIGGGDFSPNRIIPDCVRAVLSGKEIEVRNSLSTRPYQFVLEPLFAYLLIAKVQYENPSFSDYYNVGPDQVDAVTTGRIVDLFCSSWGGGAKWIDKTIPNAPHEAAYLALDNSKLKQRLKWKPVYHIGKAVEETVKWTKTFAAGDEEKIIEVMRKQISEFSKEFCK